MFNRNSNHLEVWKLRKNSTLSNKDATLAYFEALRLKRTHSKLQIMTEMYLKTKRQYQMSNKMICISDDRFDRKLLCIINSFLEAFYFALLFSLWMEEFLRNKKEAQFFTFAFLRCSEAIFTRTSWASNDLWTSPWLDWGRQVGFVTPAHVHAY